MAKHNTDKKITLKEFSEKFLPPGYIKKKIDLNNKRQNYSQIGKDIVNEVRKELKI